MNVTNLKSSEEFDSSLYTGTYRKEETLCILYSGGLDSIMAYHFAKKLNLWKNIVCLHINLGQPYANKEYDAICEAGLPVNFQYLDLSIIDNKHYQYKQPTTSLGGIPGRNTMLATIAANFGNKIWINGLIETAYIDNSLKHHVMLSKLLTLSHQQKIIVESPFQNMTKAFALYITMNYCGLTKDILVKTSSCYHINLHNCGNCSACLHRRFAGLINNIEENFKEEPLTSKAAITFLKNIYSINNEIIPDVIYAYKKINNNLYKNYIT